MVDAVSELVVIAHVAEREEVVVSRGALELWDRIDALNPFAECGDTARRHDVAGKRSSDKARAARIRGCRRRIEYGQIVPKAKPAEVAAPLRGGRNVPLARAAVANASAFVRGEKEAAVAEDSPANRAAEQVVSQRRFLQAGEVREKIRGVQIVIAEELVQRPMERVGTGF